MKIYFTSSNEVTSIVDSLQDKYKRLNVDIVDSCRDAEMIVSTNDLNHISHTNAQTCMFMGSDKRFPKCINLYRIPRTSNAQLMDVLSSFAYMLGYQAAIFAISKLHKLIPMTNVTGTNINGAVAMVIGIGVAGLNAVATLRRMGARVIALDISDSMKESAEGLNASFIQMDKDNTHAEISKYYSQYKPDIIITAVGGMAPPRLITSHMLDDMHSLIIDISVTRDDSNCEFAQDRETHFYKGNTIIGASSIIQFTQEMSAIYSNNIFNLIKLYIKNSDHEIFSSMIEYNGKTL